MPSTTFLKCTGCDSEYDPYPIQAVCKKCGSLLQYRYPYERIGKSFEGTGFWRYASLLPPVSKDNIVTLGEGGTPLRRAKNLSKKLGVKNLLLKDETTNPTNSFRDRAATLMISNALDLGYKKVICASNGNMGASIAAYSAKAGIKSTIIVPKRVDLGKLAQMHIYDAEIIEKGEIVDEAILEAEKRVNGNYQATPELNPLTIEAQKTISFEIFEQHGVPDWLIVPTGSGSTTYSIWKGFQELSALDLIKKEPRIVVVQPSGCAPITEAYKLNQDIATVEKPETRALALLVANPAYGKLALQAVRESNGTSIAVPDEQTLEAERLLAKSEGIFVEPASATTIASLQTLVNQGKISESETVVCLITATGLKAPYVLEALTKEESELRRETLRLRARGWDISTKLKILRLLDLGESYGYEIWKATDKKISIQAVYQHLDKMEQKELVDSFTKERRRYFTITKKGKRVLQALEELIALL
nr:threonine synthase [Candidatus Freyarchaeota archaeon]